jgi:hypothetical protein
MACGPFFRPAPDRFRRVAFDYCNGFKAVEVTERWGGSERSKRVSSSRARDDSPAGPR